MSKLCAVDCEKCKNRLSEGVPVGSWTYCRDCQKWVENQEPAEDEQPALFGECE